MTLTVDHAPTVSYPEPPELDHIVHLVSPGKLNEAIDQFRQLGFSVERGGIHADGFTQNALIILTDGVYIELIEFLDKPLHAASTSAQKGGRETLHEWKQRRSQHWWWGRKVGWIDWCLRGGLADGRLGGIQTATTKLEADRVAAAAEEAAAAAARANTADAPTPASEKVVTLSDGQQVGKPALVRYKAAQEGGRRALSGKEIRWNVTFPAGEQRGTYPFWCEDVTPRWWRVPTPSPPHVNLTQGLSSLTLLYHPDTFPVRLASLQVILASKFVASTPNGLSDVLNTVVDTRAPPKTDGRTALPDSFVELYLATPEGPLLPLRVKAADDPAEFEWLEANGEGLFEVEISVAPEKLPITAPPDGIERETSKRGYGRLRLHPMRAQVTLS